MAARYGLMAGAITVVIYCLAYFINPDLFLSPLVYWTTLALYVIFMLDLASKSVKQGIHNFRDLVRPLFVCFLIANAVYYCYYYIMITYIDPSIFDVQVNKMAEGFKQLNLESKESSFKWSEYILSYFQAAIGGFAIAAVIAYSKKQS